MILETTPVKPDSRKKRGFLRATFSVLRLGLINFLVFAVLAELVCFVYINVTNWPSSKPTYHLNYNTFYADINPVFGTWHRPNGHYFHQGGCYSVEYFTNSYGARDVERSVHSSRPRTVVLGDSFVEGFAMPLNERLTNILERDMGREYLNFGTSGDFGPLQYALLYKTLASKFDHDLVLVGVLPDNDFQDMSLEWGNVYHRGRYRPYYGDNFSIVYTGHSNPHAGEGLWDQIEARLRAYLASYHVGQYIYQRIYWYRAGSYSGYNDYTDIDLARLEHALMDIKQTADSRGAKVAVFLIPTPQDVARLLQKGANRLGPVMTRWGQQVGIPVKDLLPEMDARSHGNLRPYFLSCDNHWSAQGNAVAAEILERWIGAGMPQ